MKIYCIEDINDMVYVGKTNVKLNIRLSQHQYDKKNNRNGMSSSKLNLYNCIIYLLEECDDDISYDRETYYMNKLNSVNNRTGQFNSCGSKKEYNREYYKKRIEYHRNYYLNKFKN